VTSAPETAADGGARVHLVLYVSPAARTSHLAQKAMEQVLARFRTPIEYEVLDVVAAYDKAETDQVLFTPTLVKRSPLPRAWLIGDLGDGESVLDMLRTCGLEESQQ
jgi:hypothetical protein